MGQIRHREHSEHAEHTYTAHCAQAHTQQHKTLHMHYAVISARARPHIVALVHMLEVDVNIRAKEIKTGL